MRHVTAAVAAFLVAAAPAALAAQQPPQPPAAAGGSAADLAAKLANPVAALISVPFQTNYEYGIGPAGRGSRFLMNVQPVVPITLNAQWNLISRTILPIIHQQEIFPGAGTQDGIGDVLQSAFLSPSASKNGLTWGVGAVLNVPTATNRLLGTGKWGLGPTAVVLKATPQWTYGALANHVVSVAGSSSRGDLNFSFVQPFVTRVYPTGASWGFNTEATYDWENDQFSLPVSVFASQVIKIAGKQTASVGLGVRWWASAPAGAPNWSLRVPITLVYPK